MYSTFNFSVCIKVHNIRRWNNITESQHSRHIVYKVFHTNLQTVSLENNNAIVNNVSLENNDATVESQLSENDDCLTVCASEKNDSTLPQNQLDPYGISTYLDVCTCCHSTVSRHLCVLFKVHNYDFNNYVVSLALSKDIWYKHHGTPEYVCKKCHHALRREKKVQYFTIYTIQCCSLTI